MRILQICSYFYPAVSYGGPVYSVLNLCQGLTRHGVDVTVFTTNIDGNRFLEGVRTDGPVNLDGIDIYYFGWDLGKRFFFSKMLWHACRDHISEFDLVHVQGTFSFPCVVAAHYSKKHGVPFIVSPRGTLDPWSLSQKWIKKRFCLWLYEKRNLRRAAALHFTTKNEMELASKYFGVSRSIIVPNGIDFNPFKNMPARGKFRKRFGIKDSNKIILFLGRIHPKKGLDLLISGFSRVIKKFPDSWLLLAGSDEENFLDKILKLAKDNRIEKRVLTVGMLEEEQKLSALIDSDLFVLPSYGGENFGMAAVEAMASGTPIIISDKVGISSDVRQFQAGIVVPCKVDNLSEAMIKCLSDKELCNNTVANAYKLVMGKYEISKVAKQMIEEYKNVIKLYRERRRKLQCTF